MALTRLYLLQREMPTAFRVSCDIGGSCPDVGSAIDTTVCRPAPIMSGWAALTLRATAAGALGTGQVRLSTRFRRLPNRKAFRH
jgi:hypothetical protein